MLIIKILFVYLLNPTGENPKLVLYWALTGVVTPDGLKRFRLSRADTDGHTRNAAVARTTSLTEFVTAQGTLI